MDNAVRGAVMAFVLSLSSCVAGRAMMENSAPEAPRDAMKAAPTADAVILVTLDGVRWQEIFAGADPALADRALIPRGEAREARRITPNLHRLFFDEGVVLGDPRVGEPVLASGPVFVSMPGYLEIMTGAASGCGGNECEPRLPWDLAGEIANRAPAEGAAVFASWERIARTVPEGASGLFVRAGRGAKDESPAYPGGGDYRPDRATAALALDHLVHRRPRFLWIALGDTDEWAHRRDYRGYLDALRYADSVVGELVAHLAELGDYGSRAAVFVTTDHGRDAGFVDHGGAASAGVWLMARGGPIPRRGVTPLPRARHLRDVAPTIATLLGAPPRSCEGCGEAIPELL
jgi:hypothetical protein